MVANSPTGDVVLLLDWENLKESLRRQYNATLDIAAILATTRSFGRLVQARAYADWTDYPRLGADAPNLLRNAIDPIYAIGGGLKNSADLRLAVDAIDLCERLPQITTFVLGTGDGGLVHVVNFLKLRGRKVVVIAVGTALSSYLVQSADITIQYERLIDSALTPTIPAATTVEVRTATQEQPDLPSWTILADWIAAIIAELGPTPAPLTEIASKLKERHGFNSKDFNLKFLALMERIALLRPMLITSTPMPNASSNTAIHYAALAPAQESTPAQHQVPSETPDERDKLLRRALRVLPAAVIEAREKSKRKVAYPPTVQQIIQARIGHTLKELRKKPGEFFADAADQRLVRLVTVQIAGKSSLILLLPNDDIPHAT